MPAYGRHWAADPFVEAGQLAQGEINAIMDGLTRWEKLLAQLASASAAASLGYSNSDQDGDVAEQVDEARESLLWPWHLPGPLGFQPRNPLASLILKG